MAREGTGILSVLLSERRNGKNIAAGRKMLRGRGTLRLWAEKKGKKIRGDGG